MRFPPDVLAGIADGRIDRAFRRWDRPRVRAGGSQRTMIGVVGFESVEPVASDALTEEDARRSGMPSLADLRAFLDRRTTGEIYRVRIRLVGPDPRVALRETLPDDDAIEAIVQRLARLDRASSHGPWTRTVLETIRDHPAVRAADLAPRFGRERLPFKADVRRLKELGLTESLEVGYRLSPRGRAVLERLTAATDATVT
jgi:hypothetical protein